MDENVNYQTSRIRVRLDEKFEYFAVDLSSANYETAQALRETLGFTPNGGKNYPIVPNFLNLARLQLISTEAIEIDEPIVTTEVIESDEAVVENAVKKAILDATSQGSAGYRLRQSLKPNEYDGAEELENESQMQLNANMQILDDELNIAIAEMAEKLSKKLKFKLKKKVKKTSSVKRQEPSIIFAVVANKINLELQFIGRDAKFLELLVPTIRRYQDQLNQIKTWRKFGVPVEERDVDTGSTLLPYDHQWVMYKIHTSMNKSANLSQMGTGKTKAVCMAIQKRLDDGDVTKGRILVMCPATVMDNWEAQIKLHAPKLTSKILRGSYAERLSALIEQDKPDVFIVNYEIGSMKYKRKNPDGTITEIPLTKLMTIVDWDMVILDECHKIKNPNSKRTPKIIEAFGNVKYAIIMSGTINANKLHDVHMPFVFLNRARQFNPVTYDYRQQPMQFAHNVGVDKDGKKIIEMREGTGQLPLAASTLHEHFLDAYFTKDGYNHHPRHYAVADFRRKLEEVSVRFEKSECMSLPPKMYEVRLVDMHPDQANLYNALKTKLTADLGELIGRGGRVTMMNVMALFMKLAEAANGWIYDAYHNPIDFPWNPKLDALLDIVDDIDSEDKVVVWSRFTADIHKIAKKLKELYGDEAVGILHGGESCRECDSKGGARRYETVNGFNDMESGMRFIVANPAAGGEGIDLVGASYEIYFSNSFNKLHRMQSEDRCHRPGMQEKLTIIDLIMKRTIDEEAYGALRSWKSMAAALLEHLGLSVDAKGAILGPGDFTLSNEPPVISDHTAMKLEKETQNNQPTYEGNGSIN